VAVYTEVSDEELQAFVSNYDIGAVVSYKGIAEGVENSNYILQTKQGTFILTLYEKRVDPGDLPFFLYLMEHLAERDIPCPTVIHGHDGKALRTLCGRPAAIVSFLEGMWPRRIRPFHCTGVGEALARLHLAGADYTGHRTNGLGLKDWRPLFQQSAARADEVKPGLAELLDQELSFLEAHWPDELPSGVCHADLFPDNVFFLGETLSGLIDFYFACNDFLAYDLGICVNAWCFERDNSFNITKARNMLAAYSKVRSFSNEEMQALPLMCRGSAIRFLLTRLYDWLHQQDGALVKPKDPLEYLTILKFHQHVKDVGAYGLE